MSELGYQLQIFQDVHRTRGWFTGIFSDRPHEISPAHAHGEVRLLVLQGSVEFTLGDEIISAVPGYEITVPKSQSHSALAGPEGFRYAFACPPEEARLQGLQ